VEDLDLSSLESVRACAKSLTTRLQDHGVDILVNNAGVMTCPLTRTAEGYELQLGTNHLGHFLLTNLLLPLLERAAAGSGNARVVTVSSLAHEQGRIHWEDPNYERTPYSALDAYGQSKLANVLFSAELARRVAGTGITTYSLHPGVINTELSRHIGDTYGLVAEILFRYLVVLFIKTPESGAQTTLFCCLDQSLTGAYSGNQRWPVTTGQKEKGSGNGGPLAEFCMVRL
jgi:NAD(P)-dependent dehydrogenase (short-subunit alcohol dehydrogenase family)